MGHKCIEALKRRASLGYRWVVGWLVLYYYLKQLHMKLICRFQIVYVLTEILDSLQYTYVVSLFAVYDSLNDSLGNNQEF